MSEPPILLRVRPRRITIYATVASVLVVGSMIVVGILLQKSDDGVTFGVADQIGLIGIGLIFGALIMIAAAGPLLTVDERALTVRNMVGRRTFEWALIHRITFPEGAHWPLLILADDETYPIVAIQAMDRNNAVDALKTLRGLFDRYATNRPEPTPAAKAAHEAELRRQELDRPLGRLEVMDLQRARRRRR
ncbi:MAG: PH domain-containing protein [Actinomycetota bacterium]|nr:PH domain-containing protein [Actinomycetota bacterium]